MHNVGTIGHICSRLHQGKLLHLWTSALLFEYLKANIEKHISAYGILLFHMVSHGPHECGIPAVAVQKRWISKTPHLPRHFVRGLLSSFSRISAQHLTCMRASGCLFLRLPSATSSLSWVSPATQGGSPSFLPCSSSVVNSLHWWNSDSRSCSIFMES